jgi:hypothetical protein
MTERIKQSETKAKRRHLLSDKKLALQPHPLTTTSLNDYNSSFPTRTNEAGKNNDNEQFLGSSSESDVGTSSSGKKQPTKQKELDDIKRWAFQNGFSLATNEKPR